MSNTTFRGTVPFARRIKDMKAKEYGYTVPWAYDPQMGILDGDFTVSDSPGGTVELFIDCVTPGNYKVGLIEGSEYEF